MDKIKNILIVCGDLKGINQSTVTRIIDSSDQIDSCLGRLWDHIKFSQTEVV